MEETTGGIIAILISFFFIFLSIVIPCLIYLFMFLLIIVAMIFWIFMLIDCLSKRKFKTENDKIIWVIVLVFLNWIGALVYYFTIYKKGKQDEAG